MSKLAKRLALLAAVLATGNMLAQSRALFSPLEGKHLWEKSLQAMQGDNPAKALRHLRILLSHDPDNHVYLSLQGDAHRRLGDWRSVALVGERLLCSARPKMSCDFLTQSYHELKLFDKLRGAYQACLEMDPHNPQGLYEFARFHEGRGEFAEAEILYKRLGGSPSYSGARLALARMRLAQKRPADAESIISAELKASPRRPAALLLGVVSAERTGKPETARLRRKALERIGLAEDAKDPARILGIAIELEDSK
ncbi:tetratricopeptide repeat protein [Elusimicrobiota bacterium]